MADLAICGACSSALVQPTRWERAGAGRWTVALRCPECGWRAAGTYDRATVDRYDTALDDGDAKVVAALRRLEREIMRDEVELFCSALRADAVLPSDF